MKILLITRGVPHKHDLQEGCFEMDQAQALILMGHEVVTMSVESRVRFYWRKLGISKLVTGKVVSYKFFIFPSAIVRHFISQHLGYKMEAMQARYLYKKIVKEHGEFDIVHAHYLNNMFYGIHIKKKYAIKLVGTEHWSELVKEKISPWITSMGRKTYPQVDTLISVSKYLQKRLKFLFNVDSLVCGNVLALNFIDTKTLSLPFSDIRSSEIFTFVSCGSLIYLKGYDLIIEAASRLSISRDKWRVVIIGKGPLKKDLENTVINKKLSSNFVFKGQLNREQIIGTLIDADSFVLASRRETFGVVVIEALSMGVPVISTTCGGTEGLINNSNGQMIPCEDVEALKKAMERAYHERGKRNRMQIRQNCLDEYSPIAIAKKLTDIYSDTIEKRKK